MSEYLTLLRAMFKRTVITTAVCLFIAATLFSIWQTFQYQNRVANKIFTEQEAKGVNLYTPELLQKVSSQNDTKVAEYETAAGRVISSAPGEKHFSLRVVSFVDSRGGQISLYFESPILSIITSLSFIILSLVWLCIAAIVLYLTNRKLAPKLSEVTELEQWAFRSRISAENAQELISNQGSISMAVRHLQQRLSSAEQSGGRVDQYIRRKALLDSETGIGNREFFNNRLEAILADADTDTRGSAMFVQLKELDVVFSLYGHQTALSLLENCIEQMQSKLSELPKHYFIARRGVYDIALLLPGVYVDESERMADKLITAINKIELPIGANKDEFCHIGISQFGYNQKPYQIMSEADMALRSAQLQGPSQWFMFSPGEVANESAKGSLRWRTFLNWALEHDAFEIFFQPVMAVHSDDVLHYEALSKVKDKEGKLTGAGVFWPMAKKCGLSAKVDLLVFKKVCSLLMSKEKHIDNARDRKSTRLNSSH